MNRSSALQQPGELDRPASPSGYSTKDVAALLGLSASQVLSYVRAGFLAPVQGPRGEYYYSFQDLILLRTAKGLLASRVPRRRVEPRVRPGGPRLRALGAGAGGLDAHPAHAGDEAGQARGGGGLVRARR